MFLLVDRIDGSTSELTENNPAIAPRILNGLAAIACLAVVVLSAVAARADWFRRNPLASNVAEAIRLDPDNADAYTLQAELAERAARFPEAEQSWRKAVERNRYDSEAWMRISLLQERRGAIGESEQSLLDAAKVSQIWLPRWALVNFYARRGRKSECYAWSRRALERASDDVSALFPLLQNAGASRTDIQALLPQNRQVHVAWLAYQLQHSGTSSDLAHSARDLISLIPQTPPGWPGTDVAGWRERTFPVTDQERWVLVAVIDRILDEDRGAEAVELWNRFTRGGIVAGNQWTRKAPSINPQFRVETSQGGLDWRFTSSEHAEARLASDTGEFAVNLDGHQPEAVELLRQRAFIPKDLAYQFAAETRTEGLADDGSLEWQIVDGAGKKLAAMPLHPSDDWRSQTLHFAPSPSDQVVAIVLACHRPAGSVRAEGAAHFRLAALRSSP